jgi:ketosteroid isomerase-like protein
MTSGDTGELGHALIANEHRIMTALGCHDVVALRELMALDLVFLTSQGSHTAAEMFGLAARLRVEQFEIGAPRVLPAGDSACVVSYELRQHGTLDGQPFASHTYSTSLWARRDGRWWAVFHQETPVLS